LNDLSGALLFNKKYCRGQILFAPGWVKIMTRILIIVMFPLLILSFAQPSFSSDNFESFLAQKAKLIQKSSSKTVDPVLQEIQDIGGEIAAEFLQNWKDKKLYYII